MRADRMHILSQGLRTALKRERTIDEITLRDLMSAIADLIVDADEPTESFEALSRDIEALFTYGDVAESPAFSAGALWGMISTHAAIVAKESESERKSALSDIVERHRDLLVTIRDNPGITQHDLAKKLQKTKSNLAQILAHLERYHLFIVIPTGRHKKYRITSTGQTVLFGLEAKQP